MRFTAHTLRVAGLSILLAGAAALPAHAAGDAGYILDGRPSSKTAVEKLSGQVVCDATDMSDGTFECSTVDELPKPSTSAAAAATANRTFGALGEVGTLDFYDCSNGTRTYMYTDANFGGTAYQSDGATGTGIWVNLASGLDNRTSSFWARQGTTSRWHDYVNGGGAYYGNGYSCRAVENLTNASMNDSGTANDRFSSYASW